MASAKFYESIFFILFLQFHLLTPSQAGEKLIFEDGYTVSTVLDGDKSNFKVNPHSVHHQSPPSDLFVLLDSVASTFYTLSLPSTSNQTVIKRLVGNGQPGYMDGNLDSALFNKPRSFTVDFKGNVYVADQHRRTIRKISNTGVTTIAGGSSPKAGRKDGPGRDASFSDDFELTFIPQRCALMISDHGNRLVRQINLKGEDCKRHSGSVLGTTSTWLLGLGLSCLFGLTVGFVIRPYVIKYGGLKPLLPSWTWTRCLTNLERQQIAMLCSDIKSAIVKSSVYSIVIMSVSQLSLMFRYKTAKSRVTCERQTVSLLDMDELCSDNSSVIVSPGVYKDLNDLLTFDGGTKVVPVNNGNGVVDQENGRENDVFPDERDKIDGMIRANIVNFEENALTVCSSESVEFGLGLGLGLIKRR